MTNESSKPNLTASKVWAEEEAKKSKGADANAPKKFID